MNGSPNIAPAANPLPPSAMEHRLKRRPSPRVLGFIVFSLALTAAFGRDLWLLATTALESDLNSYIVLIPFVSLYFLYLDRARLPREYRTDIWWAILPIVAGSAALFVAFSGLAWTASLNNRTALLTFAFVCFLWSGGFLFLGKKWIGTAAFPVFFLIFLVPLPDQVVDWMETGLRYASADAANVLFALTGTPALKTGTFFELPGITIQVAQECSGIRSTWVLFITSIIAAQLFLSRSSSRAFLVAAVLPLGIIRNGFRIMVIGLLCVHVGPDMINSPIHRRGGPIFFALSLVPLMLLLWWLRRREIRRGLVTQSTPSATGAARPQASGTM